MANVPDRKDREPAGLSPAELEAESAEALPERAAMSTLNVPTLDAAAGTVEAVGDGIPATAEAPADAPVDPAATTDAAPETTADPAATTAEPTDVTTTAAPDATDTGADAPAVDPGTDHPGQGHGARARGGSSWSGSGALV